LGEVTRAHADISSEIKWFGFRIALGADAREFAKIKLLPATNAYQFDIDLAFDPNAAGAHPQ
jgi:hypothetical protein